MFERLRKVCLVAHGAAPSAALQCCLLHSRLHSGLAALSSCIAHCTVATPTNVALPLRMTEVLPGDHSAAYFETMLLCANVVLPVQLTKVLQGEFGVQLENMETLNPDERTLGSYNMVLLLTSTYGSGAPPASAVA